MSALTQTRARAEFREAAAALAADMPPAYNANYRPYVAALASRRLRAIYAVNFRLGALVQSPEYQAALVDAYPERQEHIRTANEYRRRLVTYLGAAGMFVRAYVATKVMDDLSDDIRAPQAGHMLDTNISTPRETLLLPDEFGASPERTGTLLVMPGGAYLYHEVTNAVGDTVNTFHRATPADGELFADAANQAWSLDRTNDALAQYAGTAVPLH